MKDVISGFLTRYSEIESYLNMLEQLEQSGAAIRHTNGSSLVIDPIWVNITRASGYLLIYNCIEATVRTAFAHLYEEVFVYPCSYSDLTADLRKIWVDQRHKTIDSYSASTKNYAECAMDLLENAIAKAEVEFDSRKLPVSGNLDADRLREIMSRHGIRFDVTPAAKGGSRLATVRQKRNNLSHGDLSFAECGRDVTGSELAQICRQTKHFLLSFLKSIKVYIDNSQFRTA